MAKALMNTGSRYDPRFLALQQEFCRKSQSFCDSLAYKELLPTCGWIVRGLAAREEMSRAKRFHSPLRLRNTMVILQPNTSDGTYIAHLLSRAASQESHCCLAAYFWYNALYLSPSPPVRTFTIVVVTLYR